MKYPNVFTKIFQITYISSIIKTVLFHILHNFFGTIINNHYYLLYPCIIFFIQNVNREADHMSFDIEDLERWRDRIFNAIHSGIVINVRNSKLFGLR